MLTSMQRPSGIAWLVAPGLAMIAVTYGLARFAYGLFLPEMRESLDLSESVLGLIGAGSYAGYCFAVLGALVFTSRTGPRFMAVAAGAVAVVGMAAVAGAPTAWVLALGVLVAGSSSGLASPPMGEAVARTVAVESQDRANALINSGTSIGVALSGPAALLVAEQWRIGWVAFALVGGAVLAWNVFAMPRKPGSDDRPEGAAQTAVPRLSMRYLVGSRSVPLFAAATGVGFASAAYWTFSRDMVVRTGDLSGTGSTIFWVVIGVSGLAGGLAGDLVRRLGLAGAFRASFLCMAAVIGFLATAPGTLRFGLHNGYRHRPRLVRLRLRRAAVGGSRRGLPAHRPGTGLRVTRSRDAGRSRRTTAYLLGLRGDGGPDYSRRSPGGASRNGLDPRRRG
jgi:predicted MFS family arabinose efflux permease